MQANDKTQLSMIPYCCCHNMWTLAAVAVYLFRMAALRRPGPRAKIAERLKRMRLAAGITQEEACARLKIARSQWFLIESGQRSIPAERIVDFALLVKVPVTELLGV